MTTAYARLPLNALRVFEAVASRLSFADAAEALHVTPAAVSQQVKSLEEQQGATLKRYQANAAQMIYGDILWGLFNSTEFTFNH